MHAIGSAHTPRMSLMTPPTPVAAPPNGSMADGWLWVSTLAAMAWSSSNSIIPALSSKTEMHQAGFSSLVVRVM